MMKKVRVRIAFLLVIMLVLSSMSFVITNAEPKLSVVVDGKSIDFDVAPFVDANSRTQVPLRFIAEQMGAEVIWEENGKSNTVTIKKAGTTIELKIGQKLALVNGVVKEFDTSCFLKDGRTFVPVRFVSEVLGAAVAWNAQSYTATISTGASTPEAPAPVPPPVIAAPPVIEAPPVTPASTYKYKNGTYTGVAKGYMPDLSVYVTLDNDKITAIEIGPNQETGAYAKLPLSVIPKKIISTQSTNVDVVSCATLTSNGIIDAVKDALSKAAN